MNSVVSLLFLLSVTTAIVSTERCSSTKNTNSKLFCYYSKLKDVNSCKCSHIILPANSDVKSIENLRNKLNGVKILITVHEFNEGLVDLLKKVKVDGLDIDLKKLDSKNDLNDFISTARSKLGSDLYTVVSIPARGELLAKYYDFKGLTKNVDSFILQTAFLGASRNVTFHPSRLSGLWDMQNADSVVDLVTGLGAPLSKLVIVAPVQAFHFTLQDEKHTAPGSPALEVKSITREDLCKKMVSDNWTLERDQDQAGPYIYRKNEWIAFDDPMSIDIKAKYARVRGLSGLALKDLSQDGGIKCGGLLLEAAYNGLSKQSRAPRGAVLQSLEREILTSSRPLDNIQVSPYRITRIIDTEGKVHSVRQDTRTEFECSRQGYFVHPRSCNRFYRCVKFNQLTDEFNVFEFDCPAGLAFDNRVEVCVWPGSLPDGSACSGSSEIAPVPRERFVCPHEIGYYADPENCRWFFACLDHGKSSLTAYEFRCPFGLVFDQDRLICEWPWLVPKCAHGHESGILVEFHGGAYGAPGTVGGIDITGARGVIGAKGSNKQQAIILENYNGLGALQPVVLGGIHGTIEEAVPKTYTSFVGGHDSLLTSHDGVNREGQQGDIDGEILQGHSLLNGNSQGQLDTSYISTSDQGGENVIHKYQPTLTHNVLVGNPIISLDENLRGGQSTGTDINRNGNKIVPSVQNVHNFNNILVAENTGLDGSSVDKHILAQHAGQRGSIRYQGDIGVANDGLTGKSTVTYHGNFGDSGNGDAYNLVNGVDNNRYVLTTDDGQYNSNQGIHLRQNIGSSQLSNLGADGQNILNQQFGQRGSVKFQRIGGLDGGSTVTYHGNFGGQASHANGDHVNSPYDQGNLGFGTRISSGEKFASNYIRTSDQEDNSKLIDQELVNNQNIVGQNLGIVGHISPNIGNIASQAPDAVVLGQIDGSNVNVDANDAQGTITYHGNAGVSLDTSSLGLNNEFINQEGNIGIVKDTSGEYISDNINSGLSDRVYDQTLHGISKLNKDNFLNTNRGSVKYQTNLGDAVTDNLDAVVLNQANQHSGTSNSYQNFNRHKTGRVNIVGGGFSAVGVYPNTYKHTTAGVHTVTASPITINPVTVTSSNIPVVTSVPIPSTSTDDKLDVYNGNGVVANVPELQVKVQSHGEAIIPNNQGIHIASTGATLEGVEGGYVYDKPTVSFVHSGSKFVEDSGAKSYIHQHINHQLANTGIPIVTETPAISTQSIRTNIAVEPIPNNQGIHVASTGAGLETVDGGYVYGKPFIQGGSKTVEDSGAKSYIHQHINHQLINTAIPLVSETPAISTQSIGTNIHVEPIPNNQGIHIASNGAALETVEGGYVYGKPTVPFVQSGSKIVEDSGAKSYIHQHINHQLINTAIPLVSETPAISTQPIGTNIHVEPIPNNQGIHIASNGAALETVEGGYVYGKSTVPFVQTGSKIVEDSGAKSYSHQHINHQLVNTAIPIVSTQPVGTNIAVEQFQTSPYNVQHFGSVNNIQEYSRNNYPKATIVFEGQREHIQPTVDTHVYSDARDHSAGSYSYQSSTPSILTQPIQQTIQQVTKPVSSVSSVHFGTAVVDNVTPSVLVQPVGETIFKQPGQTVEVSTFKPSSYSSVHHVNTAFVENVTPSVLVQSVSPIHTYDFNQAKASVIENVTPSISVQPIIKHQPISPASTISSVHFGSAVTDNITPSFDIKSVAQPISKQPVQIVEVNTARPVSYSSVHHFKTALNENVTPSILLEPVKPVLTYDINSAKSTFVDFGKAALQNSSSVLVQPYEETLVHQPIQTYEVNNIKPVVSYDSNHYRKISRVESVTPTVFVQPVGQGIVEQPAHGPISSHNSVHFGRNTLIESVTPSVLLQPSQEIRFQQPLQTVEINENKPSLYSSIHFGKTNVENVTPSVLIQPVQETRVHQPIFEQTGHFRESQGSSAYFHQNNNILKYDNIENVTPSSSFDYQSFGSKNVETQNNNLNVASVTPSILIKETTEPSAIITSFNDNLANVNAHSSFLSSISKSRGFTKYIDDQTVTPPTLLQETLVAVPEIQPLQPIQQTVLNQVVENENNRGTYSYQDTNSRGFTKFVDVQSVTPAPILQGTLPVHEVPIQQSVSNENPRTSFSYQTFGLKNPLVVDTNQEALGKDSYFKTKNEKIGYHYSRPSVIFNEEPAPSIEYEGLEPVKEEPFVAKKAYITGAQTNGQRAHGFGSTVVYEENYPVTQGPIISSTPLFVPSTVKPYHQSTIQSTYNSIPSTTVRPLKFYYHDSRLTSNARPFKANITPVTVITPKGIISSTPKPIASEAFVPIYHELGQSTVIPNSPETIVTPSKPVFKYSFSSLDSQYSSLPTPVDIEITKRPIINKIDVVTPTISPYQPVQIKSTTLQPLLEVNNLVNVPLKAYLPETTYIENYEAPILRNRSKSKAIVKVNDFHPLLSAKLGAQCTCISNTLRLKNRPVRVQIDDGENIEEFIVKPESSDLIGVNGGENINSGYDGDLGVPTYDSLNTLPDYKSQKLIVNTPVPEVIIGSTIPAVSKTPVIIRKRVRVRPIQSTTPVFFEAPVTQATDVFIKGTTSNDLQFLDEQANNVNEAAREDAKETLKAHNFDRYGPGGLRSNVETLQGTIDCQRAGLFRHPTQCNKFYSCRWDCTKNKYTLHVFNCPVHLTFDDSLGACNWPSQGPACLGNTLLPTD